MTVNKLEFDVGKTGLGEGAKQFDLKAEIYHFHCKFT